MKNKNMILYNLVLISIFLFSINNQLVGQDNVQANFKNTFDLSLEAGFPVTLNVGARYQITHTQIGVGILYYPGTEGTISVSGDVYYHFAGHSVLSNRRPWYGRIGLNYLISNSPDIIDVYIFLNLRIGRYFNISRKFGLTFDIGPSLILYQEETILNNNPWFLGSELPTLLPSFSIGMFYRL